MLFLYRCATSLAACFVRPLLFALAYKEGFFSGNGSRHGSRQGFKQALRRARELCAIPTQRPLRSTNTGKSVPLLWLHGVDIGEAQVALGLAQDLWRTSARLQVLITTTSRAAAALILIAKSSERRLHHQFAPLDCQRWYRRFLRHWRPALAVRCENEFWPNGIIETRRCCPLLFVQARMSEKSFRRWQGLAKLTLSAERSIARRTMQNIDFALCQDKASARFLDTLGVKSTKVAGNLKSLPAPRTLPASTERWFRRLLAHKNLWIAASTHAPEERSVVEAHCALRRAYPEALCIVAPRQLERVPAIERLLREQKEDFQLRSHKPSRLTAPFFLLDSFLELNSLYPWARAVFVGGTLIDKGGHNLFEPARHGCRILHGAHLQNTHAPLLKGLNLTQEVRDARDLALHLQRQFDRGDDKQERRRKQEAQQAIEQHHQALRAYVLQSLQPYLARLS